MDQATKDAFAKLTQTVERGFTAIAEDIADIRARMATKEEVSEFRAEVRAFRDHTIEELRAIRSELADIRRELDALKQRVDHMSGYSKEIDHLFERVRAIEQHLGITPKLAA
jgi:predicted  nucleic acid-binding Zn-ribbon protein